MTRRIILAGGGHAHLGVLADWARRPWPGTERWLVTASRRTAYSGMLPGWMAGLHDAEALWIELEPLAERAGARLRIGELAGLEADARRLRLRDGETLAFDRLSLAIGGETELRDLEGAGELLLPVRPVEAFVARWTAFLAAPAGPGPVRLAVVGGGAAGVELALAAVAGMRSRGRSVVVSLIAEAPGVLAGHAAGVRRRALAALADRGVQVIEGRATGTGEGLRLPGGQQLQADLVIAATGSRAPAWLGASGLALAGGGFVAVGADLRSVSHPAILAAGDIIARVDRLVARSGVHAVKAGPVLAANLRADPAHPAPAAYRPRRWTLYLLALGDRRAILSWGPFAAGGRLVWRCKDLIDRRFVQRYSKPAGRQRQRQPQGEPS